MSDFVFSTAPRASGTLARIVQSCYADNVPRVTEIHGPWGSAAVSESPYRGFGPVETDAHVIIVVGGPVLQFATATPTAGRASSNTASVLERSLGKRGIRWDDDLSGPFAVLIIEKRSGTFEVVTDLMAFIPVFCLEHEGATVVGTHVDMVARVGNEHHRRDAVSIADFILHGRVTFPFTTYAKVSQLAPATVHRFPQGRPQSRGDPYWTPTEESRYRSLAEAAGALRAGLQGYVEGAMEGIERAAVLLSGGEDARTVLGMVPRRCKTTAFVFLDAKNREGRVAAAAARAYGAEFRVELRSPSRYLDVLPACSALVGAGAQCTHVHAYGLRAIRELRDSPAVFGGLLADALHKGYRATKAVALRGFPFYLERLSSIESELGVTGGDVFESWIIDALNDRTRSRRSAVRRVRPESADEWYHLWPISMLSSAPQFWGHRRLFAAHEPFMSATSVKVAAASPQRWKINRRLFCAMARPALRRSRYLLHANGWFPYLPWQLNIPVRAVIAAARKVEVHLGVGTGNQGPWTDWSRLVGSARWRSAERALLTAAVLPERMFKRSLEGTMSSSGLDVVQRANLLQTLHECSDAVRR